MTAVQLALPVQPTGTPALMARVHDHGRRILRAECDWTRIADGWASSNGWTVRRAWIANHRDGWAAYAPDGCPEWWAHDPITAMVRAEGGS